MGLLLVMYLGAWFVLTRTRGAADVYAVGADPRAARRAGVRVRRTTLSSICWPASATGSRRGRRSAGCRSRTPRPCQLGNLDAIAAVVVGGVSLFGGRGSVFGVLAGALIVVVLRAGLAQSGVDTLYQDIVIGVLMIAAVAVDRYSLGRQR